MKTEIMNLQKAPTQQELKTLLGEHIYKCYKLLTDTIMKRLNPDKEIWDSAGRRGKYFHGYRINSKVVLLDFYLTSIEGQGQVKCQFKIPKHIFQKIEKEKDIFSPKIQDSINWSADFHKQYGEFYLNIILDEETIQDANKIIEIIV